MPPSLRGGPHNNLLSHDEIDMVVTLRIYRDFMMNRDFMQHMRLYYPGDIKDTHPTYVTIVSAQDVLEKNTRNDVDDEDQY